MQARLLTSVRGAVGGYTLAHAPHAISVADVVNAIEGPVALTECSLGKGNCSREKDCATRANWQLISRAVRVALETVSLADMALPRMQTIRMPGSAGENTKSNIDVSRPDERNTELRSRVADEYRWGFVTDIEQETVPKGLNEDVIRLISGRKNEPEFMLEWRLQAYRHWTDAHRADLVVGAPSAYRLPGDPLLTRNSHKYSRNPTSG